MSDKSSHITKALAVFRIFTNQRIAWTINEMAVFRIDRLVAVPSTGRRERVSAYRKTQREVRCLQGASQPPDPLRYVAAS